MGFLTKNTVTVVPHPLYFSLFPLLKKKLKGRHFDTIEVIETESQAVMNTITEHDFQDAFQNLRRSGNGAQARKGTTSRVMVARRSKVSFDQMAAQVPEIMVGFLIYLHIERHVKKSYLCNQDTQLISDLSVVPCALSLRDYLPN
jgi:hypothetical protein